VPTQLRHQLHQHPLQNQPQCQRELLVPDLVVLELALVELVELESCMELVEPQWRKEQRRKPKMDLDQVAPQLCKEELPNQPCIAQTARQQRPASSPCGRWTQLAS
jgi:hypothetical protein